VNTAIATFGHLDGMISNAGYALLGAVEELDEDQIEHALATNLRGPIALIRAVLPHFRARKAGRILHVSSESGQMAYPALALYHAAKWGMEGFCEALAMELAPLGIQVTLVEPGRIPTEFDSRAALARRIVDDYQKTTVGNYRRLLAMGKFPHVGDPGKIAEAIVVCAGLAKAPRRLALGSDAYRNMHRALSARLAALESQADTAAAVDRGTIL
jgi:NAD(P)-dependent dehydrogenase (short-subunit alcohol dehydrogenase family)